MNLRNKWLWCLLPALLWAVVGSAQAPDEPTTADPDQDPPLAEGVGGDTTTARRLLENPLGTGDVTIDVLHAGVGGGTSGAVRPGDWAGFQLRISDAATKPRQLIIRLVVMDADGDDVWWTTEVAGQGSGKDIPAWIYGWLPFDLGRDTQLQFKAYEALPGGSGETYRPGLQQGARPFKLTADPIPETNAMLGVVGGNLAGLDQYTASRFRGENAAPGGHEITAVIGGMIPSGLPDRWLGYSSYEALVWTGSGTNETPDRLGPAQAEAIREWVRRGGHLVVVLPSVYQQWLGGAAGVSPLADILPAVRVQTLEGVDLDDYRELLNTDDAVRLPKNAIVRTFTPENAGPFDAMPIFNNPKGQAVVVRRLVGSGAVTLVGIDVTSKALQERKGGLEAVVFWNRILGKRLQLPSQADLGRVTNSGTRPWSVRRDPPVPLDSMINETIGKTAKAAKGLLVAFVIFLAYWLLAGPVGFLFLKQKRRQQHAWVLFTAVTAAFALLGWGSTNLLKMGRDVDRHLTLVDHVYGQSNQRMRSWIELTLPKYGEQRVSVASSKESSSFDWHNTLTAWRSFNDISTLRSFPDARGYRVDSRKPDAAEFPARATTRQLQIDTAGSVPANWQMPRPQAVEGVETGKEIWIEEGVGERGWTIHGQLVHNLPGKLRNVHVVVVREQRNPRVSARGSLFPADAWVGRRRTDWDPNTALDLNADIPTKTGERGADGPTTIFANLRGNASPGQNYTGAPRVELERGLMGFSLLSMLEPPDEMATGSVPWCYRTSTHTWDLGRWFTQPCVMVIGVLGGPGLDGVECPVPVSLDSSSPEETRSRIKGITLVRWIYPLPPRPPLIRAASKAAELEGDLPPVAPVAPVGAPSGNTTGRPPER